nr:MAG TPA: hypothetical protein [Caudoviricetes sp.]
MCIRRGISGADYNFCNGNSLRNDLRLFNNSRSKKIGEKIW